MDFNFVTPRLATGAAINDLPDVDVLAKAGITHVINCRDDHDESPLFVNQPQIIYLWNPTADDGKPKTPDWFSRSLMLALDALSRPKNKVYAHCAAGVNRGPSTAYAILRALGFTPGSAEAVIRTARPWVGLAYKRDADAAIKALLYE